MIKALSNHDDNAFLLFMHFDLNVEINCLLKCVVCSIYEFYEL